MCVAPDWRACHRASARINRPSDTFLLYDGNVIFDGSQPVQARHQDAFEVAYADGHVRAVHQAMQAGVDVRGYFVWSLMDNFEWTEGFHQRFGLVHVDFTDQRRTLKDSARWYADVVARHGL